MAMKLTPEQRVQKASLAIVNHPKYCAVGGVLMFGVTTVDTNTPTACTDGCDVWFGEKFIEDMPDPQLRFLTLHETYHKAKRDMLMWRHLWEEDALLANIACDHASNIQLTDLDAGEGFIVMPPGGYCDFRFRGMDPGEIFRILKQEQETGRGGRGGEGKGFDNHDWGKAKGMSKEAVKEMSQKIDEALRQGQIIAGKKGGGMDRSLGALLEPQVNWREALREFVSAECSGDDESTWSKVNRRYIHAGIYMPGTISETIGRIGLFEDASGSIGGDALRDALSESVGACRAVSPELIDLVYWDSEVRRHEKYGPSDIDSIAASTKPSGGGGTVLSCVTEYLRKENIKLECALVFTDGYVGNDWGGVWPCPVMFVIIGGNKVVAPIGKTIHVK